MTAIENFSKAVIEKEYIRKGTDKSHKERREPERVQLDHLEMTIFK